MDLNGIENVNFLKSAVIRHPNLSSAPASRNYCSMVTTALGAAKMLVEPASCLQDEVVSITVDGLQPGQEITLEASMTNANGVQYHSYALYKLLRSGLSSHRTGREPNTTMESPDPLIHMITTEPLVLLSLSLQDYENGQVNVNTMESLGGSYEGVFPMGLLGTLSPLLKEHKYTRFMKRDVENPNVVTLSAFRGHLIHEEITAQNRNEPLSTATHLRHYMAPGVQRIPVRYRKVRGCLFLPPGDGPFPGVVDMYGSAGGLLEHRSAQLASRGIASLALAFFAYDDLSERIQDLNISYFEEAVEFLLKHDKILKPSVGVIGTSKGGDLSLSMSTFIPEVTAAVCINGCISNMLSQLNLHNSTIPELEADISKLKIIEDVIDACEVFEDPLDHPETIIPIEKADANFLFLASVDDRNWKSDLYADFAVERLKQAGKRNYMVHKYPDAGHLLEPPFCTFTRISYHKGLGINMLWGGKPRPHVEAQVHAWEATLGFFKRHLQNPANCKGKL